eukprot:1159924-Pelagomonas_calceolata.AAC.8
MVSRYGAMALQRSLAGCACSSHEVASGPDQAILYTLLDGFWPLISLSMKLDLLLLYPSLLYHVHLHMCVHVHTSTELFNSSWPDTQLQFYGLLYS